MLRFSGNNITAYINTGHVMILPGFSILFKNSILQSAFSEFSITLTDEGIACIYLSRASTDYDAQYEGDYRLTVSPIVKSSGKTVWHTSLTFTVSNLARSQFSCIIEPDSACMSTTMAALHSSCNKIFASFPAGDNNEAIGKYAKAFFKNIDCEFNSILMRHRTRTLEQLTNEPPDVTTMLNGINIAMTDALAKQSNQPNNNLGFAPQ